MEVRRRCCYPADTTAMQSVQRVRGVLGGGVDSAVHVAADLSITAEIVRPGGKFTSISGAAAAETAPAVRIRFVRR
jgi:hypothetical protein